MAKVNPAHLPHTKPTAIFGTLGDDFTAMLPKAHAPPTPMPDRKSEGRKPLLFDFESAALAVRIYMRPPAPCDYLPSFPSRLYQRWVRSSVGRR